MIPPFLTPPTLTLPLKGGGNGSRNSLPSPLEGEGRVGGVSRVGYQRSRGARDETQAAQRW